ncbi:MAG TPA: NAD(P)/FAD-dependent oxidoreductase [Syntrophales bacterium]|nr:NAD(P)/FAD-dependent oxidoreductase [Syntrophales bacterium]
MKDLDSFQITVIGAGVVGLAVAEELSTSFRDVLVVEKNTTFGQETSSRNSEIIHAGIHYPAGFLKSILCIEGNRLLYDICDRRNIPHKRLGKLIVASDAEECHDLEIIKEQAKEKGVTDLVLLGKGQVRRLEPEVKALSALLSPSTGIIDTHSFMRFLCQNAEARGAVIAFRSCVTAIHRDDCGYEVEINGGDYRFMTKVLVNCAGLQSDKIAALAGMDIDKLGYRLKYCKGDYFSLSPAPKLRRLVYPAPVKNGEGLGIHATLDLNNRVRLGPDSGYVKELVYSVDEAKKFPFYQSVKKYLPNIAPESLHPDMSGIRPKLQGPGEPHHDFVIKEEKDRGCPGFINLIGIESPGLTSCIAIGKLVSSLVEEALQ